MSMSASSPPPRSTHGFIETGPDDYETELAYLETARLSSPKSRNTSHEPRRWLSVDNPQAWEPTAGGTLPPVMLHFAVNRPIGATRGEGDPVQCGFALHPQSAGASSSAGAPAGWG